MTPSARGCPRVIPRLLSVLFLVATFLAVACARPGPSPDTVFAGRFVTLDEGRPEVEALAVTDGRIVAVGSRDEVEALAGAGTRTVEIPGVAVPGFIDAHVHPADVGRLLERLNLRGLTKEEILDRVAEAARTTPPGEWIRGTGWDEGFFEAPVPPTAAELEAVSPDHPVVLRRIDSHSSVVDSDALEAAGITADTPDPEGGLIVRGAGGRPTGMLVDDAQALVDRVIPDADSPGARKRHLRAALDQYARWGLTGIHDAGAGLEEIAIYREFLEAGDLPVRVDAMAQGAEAVEHYLSRGPEIDLGDGMLTVRSFKVMLDGALGSRGALLAEPYADAPDERGLRQIDEAELDTLIRDARKRGFQVAAHAIGDEAVRWGLDAFERGRVTTEDRFRIEHASIIAPADVPRFAGLGVIASMQPVFVGEYGRWAVDRLGPERVRWVMPIRDLLEAGVVLASGTDFPASDSGDPIDTLDALVNRRGADGEPEGGWYPEQAIGVDAALRSMSAGPAFAALRQDELGELTVGRLADFTVLSADPREVPAEEVGGLSVRMTVMGGRVTFDPAGAGSDAPGGDAAPGTVALPGAATLTDGPASPPFYNVVVDEDVHIPMRDGVTLGATMLHPDAPGTFPTLVYRTPYRKNSYGGWAEFPWKAARRGFLVFLVDVRGRYTSEGTFRAYHQEKQDGYDTIEWAGSHERSSGRVGSWGGSYPGYVQWLALAEDPPHYATAIPDMTPTSSHQLFYLGGAFGLAYMEWFHGSIFADLRRRAGDRSGPWDDAASREAWNEVRRRWYLHRPLVDVPHMKEHAPYFYDWLTHPDDTGWWDFADAEDDFERMDVPVLLVSGWYDSTYGPLGAISGFRGMRERAATAVAREETRLILGPWTHTSLDVFTTGSYGRELGPSAGIAFDEVMLRWFERWLAGVDNGVDDEPAARIFVMGENRWRAEEDFPLAREEPTPIYLHGAPSGALDGGRLSFEAPEAPQGDDAASRWVYDPSNPLWLPDWPAPESLAKVISGERDDVLVFTSEPLEEPLEVTGEIVARLFVSSDARDTDLSVTVCDIAPDGTTYSLTGPEAGYLRLRYREGLDRQVLMEPGKVYEVEVGSLITSNVFLPGHRIQVLITSSRLPHFDANPNTGGEIATETRVVPARQTLYHDRSRPSSIVLPVIPRTSSR